jgi:hypothetical protein
MKCTVSLGSSIWFALPSDVTLAVGDQTIVSMSSVPGWTKLQAIAAGQTTLNFMVHGVGYAFLTLAVCQPTGTPTGPTGTPTGPTGTPTGPTGSTGSSMASPSHR